MTVLLGKYMAKATAMAKIAPEAPTMGVHGVKIQQQIPANIPALKLSVKNRFVPSTRSTSLPNIQSTSILKIRCHGSVVLCRNIYVRNCHSHKCPIVSGG